MFQNIVELQDKMLNITEDLIELSSKNKQEVLALTNELQSIVLFLLQSQAEYNISDRDILNMLQDTLSGLEQEDAVLLRDVIKYGWVPLLKKVENIMKNGEKLYE